MNDNTLYIDAHLAAFFDAAEIIVGDGAAHARRADPARLDSLLAQLDPSSTRQRLVIDFETGGLRRIALQIGDSERAFEVFATHVQGPQDQGTTH